MPSRPHARADRPRKNTQMQRNGSSTRRRAASSKASSIGSISGRRPSKRPPMNVPTSVPSAVVREPSRRVGNETLCDRQVLAELGKSTRDGEPWKHARVRGDLRDRPSIRISEHGHALRDRFPRPTRVHEHLRVLPAKERRPRGSALRDPSFDPSFRLVEVAQPEEPRLRRDHRAAAGIVPRRVVEHTRREQSDNLCGVDRASAASARGRPSRRRLDVDRPPRDRVARRARSQRGTAPRHSPSRAARGRQAQTP